MAADESKKRRRSSTSVSRMLKLNRATCWTPAVAVSRKVRRGVLGFHMPSLAAGHDRARIDGVAVFLHLDHLAFFVDQISHATSSFVAGVVDAIFLAGVAAKIAQQRKCHSNLLCPGF